MKTITIRSEGVLLDALLAVEFGPVVGRQMVAATLDLNTGLADLGTELPVGTVVSLPDAPSPTTTLTQPVSLFG